MKQYFEWFLLSCPLSWYIQVWCNLVFGIKYPLSNVPIFRFPLVTLFNESAGVMIGVWMFGLIVFTLFIGLFYTAYRRLWKWFGAYALIGGGLWMLL